MAAEEIDENDVQFSLKYPHVDGLQVLAYSPDGRYLYSGGSDTYIRVHDCDDFDQEPHLIEHVDAPLTSLHCSFDSLVASYGKGDVCLFSHQAPHSMTDLITRTNPGAEPRCVKFGYNGRKLAVGSDEMIVKVIDTRDTTKVQQLAGHEAAVRGLAWNPDGTLLVTSSCDGSMRVWDMSSDETVEPSCVKEIKDVIIGGDPSSTKSCEAQWHPSGQFFVVASKTHDIVMIARENWDRLGAFDQEGHNSEICALSWSPNGNYLASAGTDNQIIVWETSTRRPIYTVKHNPQDPTNTISALLWRPGTGGNTLAIADTSGQLTQWSSVVTASKAHPSDGPTLYGRQQTTAAAPQPPQPNGQTSAPQPGPSRLKQPSSKAPAAAPSLFDDDDDDGWIDDDMGGAYNDNDGGDDNDLPPPLDTRDPRTRKSAPRRPGGIATGALNLAAVGGNQPQAPFQPGSTPWKDKRRYLAFNHIGIIHAVDRDIHHLITVEFHDRAAHRGYHFDDNYKFTMASLGEHGALYACPQQGDMPSVIHYRPFDSWTLQPDWHMNLPHGESAVAVGVGGIPSSTVNDGLEPAVGKGCCVVATDEGYLRFFSTGGIQLHLIDLGEDVVSMTVGREWALIVHRRQGVVQDGRQHLNFTILDCDTFEIVQQGHLPLVKGVQLQWLGFTEEQLPTIYKSNGVLSCLQRPRRPGQGRWTAALDTNTLARREGKQESYWPVSVTSSQMNYIILKGEEKHPFFPTPLLQEMPLQMPLLGLQEQQGQLEENFLRDTLISGHLKDGLDPHDRGERSRLVSITLDIDKHLLKLMQIACKADKLEQALDAARLLGQPQSLDAAAKLARFFHQRGLQERIELIKEARTGETSQEKERKESKWGHLVDNRTLVDSSRQASEYAPVPKRSESSSLSKPVQLSAPSRRSLGDGAALGQMPTRAPVVKQADSGLGSSSDPPEYDTRMPIEEDEPEAEEETQLEETLEEPVANTPVEPAAPGPKPKAANPFAKQNKPAAGPPNSSNPFAKKAVGKQTELKKSGSFFDRVESSATSAPKKAGSKDSSKQSTLFGMKPPEPAAEAPKKKGGKKRKTSDDSEEKSVPANGLANFLYKGNKDSEKPAEAIPEADKSAGQVTASPEPMKRARTESPPEAAEAEAEE